GNVNGISFMHIENLVGGALDDTFAFASGGSLAGSIDGGAGANTLSYATYGSPVTVNLATNTATGVGTTFSNMQNLVGSPQGDTLIGPNVVSVWNITGTNSGDVNGFTFGGIENLTGNTNADTFKFHGTAGVTGAIDGGVGGVPNVLDYSL